MDELEAFPREAIALRPVGEREHDLLVDGLLPLRPPSGDYQHADLPQVAQAITNAARQNRAIIVVIGGHVVKLGLARFLIDLMEKGLLTHLATNGSGVIHDFELALFGGTSENVAMWIQRGQFGLWQETSQLNDDICEGADRNEGLGQAVGRAILQQRLPHSDVSVAAAAYRLGIPFTSHVTIGADIIHAMPNCDGAAFGKTSYADFLSLASSVRNLEGGVFLNIGSAVTGPEVYLKALSMARNVAHQQDEEIRHFTTVVFDLVDLPANFRDGPPPKDHPLYYYRPWKTILCRTVADGGTSHYIRGDHRQTIPALWKLLG